MLKGILLTVMTLFYTLVFAQTIHSSNSCQIKWDILLKMNVYTTVEQAPEYPGGYIALISLILKNYKLKNGEDFQATIKLEFVIDTKGRLIGERIVHKDFRETTAAEKKALRVLKKAANWKPGICNGIYVPVSIDFPINF